MFRRVLVAVLRLALRVFFRRIEVRGRGRVPRDGAVVFVVNHPNALVDPVFVLCHAPRRVSFLAKEPLFRMPVIRWLVRAMEAIPVYRKQDEGSDPARNRETFERAGELLRRGVAVAICPEGVSHSDAKLRPLKTGAARIALAVASSAPPIDLHIVPAGIYYTAKTAFRSAALLFFGEPIKVEAVALDAEGQPPREAVNSLRERIWLALRDVTLNAEHESAVELVARAERIFSAESDGERRSLRRELSLRQQFLDGYAFHFERDPARLAALEARVRRYEEELRLAGIDPEDLSAPQAGVVGIARHLLTRVLPVLCLAPLALAGALLHYPTYRLTGFLATRLSNKSDDMVSTIKIVASVLLFPLTWLALAAVAYALLGRAAALAALAAAPLAGWTAVRFSEKIDDFVGGARAVRFYLTRRWFFKELLVERRRLREEMQALGEEAARASSSGASLPSAPTGHTV
ncbi:MAG TPA: lysophospholipid acyltransferase family protein [Pyrinomonadaceae bacterium]|nr:lysophospholipid acyltransferase family protein [Pyrinomonadaceae bacterium]